MMPMSSFAGQRVHLAFLLAIDEVVVVLHRDEPFEVQLIAGVEGVGELVGPHRTRAEVSGFAPTDGVVERAEGLLDRGLGVPAVDLIEVHGVHAQPVERVVEFLVDGLSREAARVGVVVAHLAPDLGGDHLCVAVVLGERVAEDSL